MRKKTKQTEETVVDDMFTSSDKDEIQRLAKVVYATQKDMDSIYHLYKKYINPKAPMYKIDCQCATSITTYWTKLLEFYSENGSKFQ